MTTETSSGLVLSKIDELNTMAVQSSQLLNANDTAMAASATSWRQASSRDSIYQQQQPSATIAADHRTPHTDQDEVAAILTLQPHINKKTNRDVTYKLRLQFPRWILAGSVEVITYMAPNGWGFKLRTHRILPEQSEWFQACAQADWPLAKGLMSSGRASPFDRDRDGWNGLHVHLSSCQV